MTRGALKSADRGIEGRYKRTKIMTDQNRQEELANDFMALHHSSEILILPNAWDVVSAKIFEIEGFKAIGTTSAGIAATLGYADGQQMSLVENLDVVRRIVNGTDVPVSADIESGYAASIDGVVHCAEAVMDAGAIGLNLEDGSGDIESPLFDQSLQAEKISAMRETSVSKGKQLFINARTDVFLVGENNTAVVREAVERGNAYRAAGADCIFVPDVGNLDPNAIEILAQEIDAPINIIAGDTTPPIAVLQDMGVARVSVGPRPMRAVLSSLRKIARELRESGTYELMMESSISYSEVNQWFTGTKT